MPYRYWLAGLVVLSLVALGQAQTATVQVSWTHSISSNVIGYRIHQGLASRQYDTIYDVGYVQGAAIDGLPVGQRHYFAATSYTADGRESVYSNEGSIIVGQVADTEPPTVAILQPLDGATVLCKSWVTILVDAQDNVGVTEVVCAVNGQVVGSATQEPYQIPWKVPAARRKTYRLQCVARDVAGNTGQSAVVTVTTR